MKPSITQEMQRAFSSFVAAEFAYFTPKGDPLCWPVTPYWDAERGILSITTGLAYPTKADHPKKNPKVALFFSDPTGTGLSTPPILVRGNATVLDQDIQANTDRYVTELRRKFPVARLGLNSLTVKMLDFYLPRLWVEIEPVEVLSSPAVDPFDMPRSDTPAPRPACSAEEVDALSKVVGDLGEGVVTIAGGDGYPFMVRTELLARPDGTVLLADAMPSGAACISLHSHTLGGTRFKAWMVRGTITNAVGSCVFIPKRLVGFFGNGSVFPLSVIPRVSGLRKRLHAELARRGQPMPHLRIPR